MLRRPSATAALNKKICHGALQMSIPRPPIRLSSEQPVRRRLMKAELTKEHQWLQKLVGEWEYEFSEPARPGEQAALGKGTETVRSLMGTWVVG